jgi:glycine hydroxymethyltransferase
MGPGEMAQIVSLIGRAIRDTTGEQAGSIAAEVGDLVAAHPAYPEPTA